MTDKSKDFAGDAKITPLCLAVSGKYDGMVYEGIKVTPLLEEEKILISVKVENNGLKTVADVAFPVKDQTAERFHQIMKRSIGRTLQVLI